MKPVPQVISIRHQPEPALWGGGRGSSPKLSTAHTLARSCRLSSPSLSRSARSAIYVVDHKGMIHSTLHTESHGRRRRDILHQRLDPMIMQCSITHPRDHRPIVDPHRSTARGGEWGGKGCYLMQEDHGRRQSLRAGNHAGTVSLASHSPKPAPGLNKTPTFCGHEAILHSPPPSSGGAPLTDSMRPLHT